MMSRYARGWLIALCVLCIGAASAAEPTAGSDWRLVEEHWYVVEIADAPAGWMSVMVHSDGQLFRTDATVHLSVRRGQVPLDIEMRSSFVETDDGEPVSMSSVQDMGIESVEI